MTMRLVVPGRRTGHPQPCAKTGWAAIPRSTVVSALLALLLAVTGGSPAGAAANETTVVLGARTLPIAPLGPVNPWPRFRFQIRNSPVRVAETLSAEDRAGMFRNAAVSPMPYLMQENYTRARRNGELPAITVENGFLRAVLYPTLGGRMISLYDKRGRRELLFNNPVVQPANLAIRNAWFSGGVEWNGPLYGHSLQTCSPVFAAVIETSRGPLLRLYEFDRALETTWQVDLMLPAGEDRLWVHVKARNPNAHAIDFYWWTNLAVPFTPDTRVLSPVDYALSHEAGGNARIAFPDFAGFDGSYPSRYPSSKSVFFRKPGIERPWSVCVDSHGLGLSHGSTATLAGRKLFTWGNTRGGQRWMDYLAAPGQGAYVEIQGGVTPTQLQTRPIKAGASLEWTECFGPFAMDAAAACDASFAAACAAAGRVIDGRVPVALLRKWDEFLAGQADTPVRTVLHRGTGWGRLHEQRTGRKLGSGLDFNREPGDEERPWAELLAAGTFSTATLGTPPRSFVVSPGWVARLEKSARERGATWLHHLHLGVARLEAGAFAVAKAAFEASLSMEENALAHRNLALLHERDGAVDTALAAYQRAWPLSGSDVNLAVEYGGFLMRHKRVPAFKAFVQSLSAATAGHERLQLMTAQVALTEGNYAVVRELLQREFCTVREGEVSLTDLWFQSHQQEAEQRQGRELTSAERRDLQRQFPPPQEIDFRMR